MIFHSTWSRATGSVASKRALYSQAYSGRLPNGPLLNTRRMPSMMCRTTFLRRIGWLTTSGMNWLHALVSDVLCERATLLTEPWLVFLSCPCNAGRAVDP